MLAATLRITALAALMMWSTVATAASYDPDMKWRTIQTEHFNIHFHQGEEALAEEFSHIVEDVYDTMTEEMQWTPRRRTEVVIVDRTDYANGYASVIPYNQIVLFATAPTGDSTLNLYEDWATTLFTHELTHILHMDTNHGIVRAARAVVGRIASTNDLSPWWMVEGLATFQETRQTTGGRGRSSWPDMIKRTAVVEDAFPPLGNLDGLQPYPPSGNLRYLFGQDFIQYVADTHGEDVWTRWTHLYGSSLPYVFDLPGPPSKKPVWPANRVFGEAFVPMYRDWRRHLFDKYNAQAQAVRDEGETIGRLISGGEASCIAPAFSPDGDHLVWSCTDLKTGNAIWKSDGEGYAREILLQDRGAGHFTWRSDSQAFVYAGVRLVNRFNTWSDINLYTLGSERPRSLTSGARARDPDFSPDGSRLLYVTNRAQNNQLEVFTVDQRRTPLTDHSDHTQYGTPRFSPDGEAVAVSMWRDGRRDLWILDPQGQPLRRITADAHIDDDPVWSADGQWLFFSSDRSGIPNIYAVEVETEALFQVTHVVTGAVKPSIHPSGQWMAYQQYSENGWDIRILDLDPEAFLPRGTLPRPVRYDTPLRELVGPPLPRPEDAEVASAWEDVGHFLDHRDRHTWGGLPALQPVRAQQPPSEGLDSFDDTEVDDVYGEEEDYPFTYPPRRYNPLPTLIPRFIAPYVQSTTEPPGPTFEKLTPSFYPYGLQGSISSGASDPLRHFGWSAWGTYRTDVEAFGGGGSFTINRFIPVYSISASTAASPRGRVPLVDPDAPVDPNGTLVVDRETGPTYWERRDTFTASVGWPYRLRSSVFAYYQYTDRGSIFDLPADTWYPEVPLRGRTGALALGYRYSWDQGTPLSISREDGRIFSLVGNMMHPLLGTLVIEEDGSTNPLSQFQITTEVREYTVNPWIPNHVLAVRGGGGLTVGATDFLGNYLLGGSFGDGAFYVTPDEFRMVRGYPFGTDLGDMYWLGNVEYRFPIWQIQRGVGTIPAYARYLSGAVFLDSGNAFNSPSQSGQAGSLANLGAAAIDNPLVGVGGELTFRTVVGWGLGITGRAGYAIGLTPGGFRPADGLGATYFQIGGSF